MELRPLWQSTVHTHMRVGSFICKEWTWGLCVSNVHGFSFSPQVPVNSEAPCNSSMGRTGRPTILCGRQGAAHMGVLDPREQLRAQQVSSSLDPWLSSSPIACVVPGDVHKSQSCLRVRWLYTCLCDHWFLIQALLIWFFHFLQLSVNKARRIREAGTEPSMVILFHQLVKSGPP